MMKSYTAKKPDESDTERRLEECSMSKERLPISEICASSALDALLQSKVELKISIPVARCEGADYVSEKTTGTDLPPEIQFMGTAGLGLKRKTENQQNQLQQGNVGLVGPNSKQIKKPKTLYEKRKHLQAEILRYGVAAIEKLYPRQLYGNKKISPLKGNLVRTTPIKMKPKPLGFDFAEIDARQILKPYSHDKYIHEPEFDTVVYISRRKGLVPLSSLCNDAETVLPSNVKFITGRNVRMGKPGLYVKDSGSGRILAIGGSRAPPMSPIYPYVTPSHTIKVLGVPALVQKPGDGFKMFEMDHEYANFAVRALQTIPKRFTSRVDIRTIKRQQKNVKPETPKDLKSTLQAENRSIVTHLLQKFDKLNQVELKPEVPREGLENDSSETDQQSEEQKEQQHDIIIKMETESEGEEDMAGKVTNTEAETSSKTDAETDKEEEESDDSLEWNDPRKRFVDNPANIRNSWSGKFKINEYHEDKPVITDAFRKAFEERKRKQKESCLLNGWEECDVIDCFCKEEALGTETGNGMATECQTPTANTSGTQTPVASESASKEKKKVAKNLTKVRRALKVLGVNFYEFDDENGDKRDDLSCDKDFCRLGCVCDTMSRKPLAPAHCGKYDCMFACACSEDALKIATSPTRTTEDGYSFRRGLTDQGSMVQLRSSSLKGMALEERKFVNTVVAGAGGDLLMLGTSAGRQKRERKLPSRYQDTDAFDTSLIMDTLDLRKPDNFAQVEGLEGRHPQHLGVASVRSCSDDRNLKRLKMEHLNEETIKKCTVIIPRLDLPCSVKPWCMYHCVYSCPCDKFKNPLEYGPDLTASRNTAKRSLGGSFITENQDPNQKKTQAYVPTGNHIPFPVKPVSSRSNSISATSAPNPSKQASKEYKFNHEEHSSRTKGLIIKPKFKTQMPHKFELGKAHQEEKLLTHSLEGNNVQQFRIGGGLSGIQTIKKPAGAATPGTGAKSSEVKVVQNPNDPLDLVVRPKGEVQYIRWNVLRSKFEKKEVTLWCFYRQNRPALFITKSTEAPYLRQAFDVRLFKERGQPEQPLPPLVESLVADEGKVTPKMEDEDKNKYAILSSSGFSWEINGVLQKKASAIAPAAVSAAKRPSQDSQAGTQPNAANVRLPSVPLPPGSLGSSMLTLQPRPPIKIHTAPAESEKAQEPTEGESGLSCMVNLDSPVAKLPVGKNLVTMTRNNLAVMQIKLPYTTMQQHWSTIKVDGKEGSVQCPESTLALKVAVLKQAANLAMKENTTVRIPIPVAGETESFGVYAVPGLQTHVFVGPFTAKIKVAKKPAGPAELICLDDDEISEVKSQQPHTAEGQRQPKPAPLDDDDIQEIFPDINSPTPLPNPENGFVIKFGEVAQENRPTTAEEKLKEKKDKEARLIEREKILKGQIPQVITKQNSEEKEIEIVNLDEEGPQQIPVKISASKLPYLNVPQSEHGRVIYREDENKIFENEESLVVLNEPRLGKIRAHYSTKRVTFKHPTMKNHEVVCLNVEKAKMWLSHFAKTAFFKSQFGQVVNSEGEESPRKDGVTTTTINVPKLGVIRVKNFDNKFAFYHPSLINYRVVCTTLENAKMWLKEYIKETYFSVKDTSESPVTLSLKNDLPVGAVEAKTAEESAVKTVDLVPPVKNVPVIQNRPKQHLARPVQNGSQKSAAIFLDRRRLKDKQKLFFKLNEVVASNIFKRRLSSVEILLQAVESINSLTTEHTNLEQEKKSLMIRRTKLFEEFTSKLQGLPVAVKKKAVMDLKEALKKGKEAAKPADPQSEAGKQVNPTTQSPMNNQQQSLPQKPQNDVFVQDSDLFQFAGPGTPYSDLTGLQTIKKDGKVMRPMNAFMLWAKAYRRELISKGYDGATVSIMLADKWKTMNQEQKQQFYTEADHLKTLHQQQHPNYKYSPKARRPGLSKKGSPVRGSVALEKMQTPYQPQQQQQQHLHQQQPQQQQQQFQIQQIDQRFVPTSQVFTNPGPPALTPGPPALTLGPPALTPRPVLIRPQDQLQFQQQPNLPNQQLNHSQILLNHQPQQQQSVRPRMPGLIQIPQIIETNDEQKTIIEISLD